VDSPGKGLEKAFLTPTEARSAVAVRNDCSPKAIPGGDTTP
jgi:hypothetical protein